MIFAIIGLGFILIAVYFIYAGFKYTRMISNIFLSLVYRPAIDPLTSFRGEKIMILDSKDHEIEALLFEKKDAQTAVIFCHESGETKESWEKYAYFLPDLGCHVLSVDFGAKPASSEENSFAQWPTTDDVQRILTVIRWVKKAFKPEIRIILFGVSFGANVALAASLEDTHVRAVVADGLFSMKEIFRDYIRKWAPILVKPNLFGENYPAVVVNIFAGLGFWYSQKVSHKKFVDVEALLAKKHPPLFMIHGEYDDYVPTGHQETLEKSNHWKGSLSRLVIPKAGHNEAVKLGRQAYEQNVADFLKQIP